MSYNENSNSNINNIVKSNDYNNVLRMENENLNIEIKKLYGIITKLKNQILTDKNISNLEKKEKEIQIFNQKIIENNKILEQYKSKIILYEKEITRLNNQINSITNKENKENNNEKIKVIKEIKMHNFKNLIIVKTGTLYFQPTIINKPNDIINDNNHININNITLKDKSIFVTGKEEDVKIINKNKTLEQKNIYNIDIINKKNNELKNMMNINKKVNEDLMKYVNLTNKYKNEINNIKAEKISLEDLIIKQEEKITYLSKRIIDINKQKDINFQKSKIYISNLEETLKDLYKEFAILKKKKNMITNKSNDSINIYNSEKKILSANNSPKYRKIYFFNNNSKNVLSFNKIKSNVNNKRNSYRYENKKHLKSLNLKSIQVNTKPFINIHNIYRNKYRNIIDINKKESIDVNNKKNNEIVKNSRNSLENENININKRVLHRGKSSILLKKNLALANNEQQDKKNIDELKSMFEQIIDDINKN